MTHSHRLASLLMEAARFYCTTLVGDPGAPFADLAAARQRLLTAALDYFYAPSYGPEDPPEGSRDPMAALSAMIDAAYAYGEADRNAYGQHERQGQR